MKKQFPGWLLALILFASCGKDPITPGTGNPPPGSDTTTLTPYATALVHMEKVANEMEWIASQFVVHGNQYPTGSQFFSSATVRAETTDVGKAYLLTFDKTKTSTDGKKRSGELYVEIVSSNNNIFVSPDGYQINDTLIDGTFFFERELNQQQKIDMNLTVLNGRYGNDISFSMERTQTMTAGSNTPDNEADDVFENVNGNYYFTVINYGLAEAAVKSVVKETYSHKNLKGFTPAEGRIQYTLPNSSSKVLNFGNGTVQAKPYVEND